MKHADAPDDAVGTFADDIEDCVVAAYDEARQAFVRHGTSEEEMVVESEGAWLPTIVQSLRRALAQTRISPFLVIMKAHSSFA